MRLQEIIESNRACDVSVDDQSGGAVSTSLGVRIRTHREKADVMPFAYDNESNGRSRLLNAEFLPNIINGL